MKADMKALLRAADQNRAERVPPGFQTVKAWADETGYSRPATQRKLARLLAAGKVELKWFRISVGMFVRPTPHYRAK